MRGGLRLYGWRVWRRGKMSDGDRWNMIGNECKVSMRKRAQTRIGSRG
jgi:hypothetical protein